MLFGRALCRFLPSNRIVRSLTSWELSFNTHGEPLDVLQERITEVKKPFNNEVLVNFRAAPINPSDINTIQGVYPIKPHLPAVGGNEGAGFVIECGCDVSSLKPGDLVFPVNNCAGTWRTAGKFAEKDLIKVDKRISLRIAAMFKVNPPTAYLMLTSYVNLRPGDCIIQNGSTSAVGILLMQMCKIMGVNSSNLKKRATHETNEATRKALLDFGGTVAVTDDELKDSDDVKKLGKSRIAFNCLGGKPTLSLIRNLDNSGILVTYGGMTKQPIPVPAGPLIFKDIQLRGFWMSGKPLTPEYLMKRTKVFDTLAEWVIDGKLRFPSPEEIPYDDWKKAISSAVFNDETPSHLPKKSLLIFPEIK